jgi:hypothetical protein
MYGLGAVLQTLVRDVSQCLEVGVFHGPGRVFVTAICDLPRARRGRPETENAVAWLHRPPALPRSLARLSVDGAVPTAVVGSAVDANGPNNLSAPAAERPGPNVPKHHLALRARAVRARRERT